MRKIIGVLLIFGLAATGFAKINIPGFTFVKQTTEGDLTVELYQNTSGNTVTLRYSGLLSQDLMSKMASWSSTFFSWKTISVEKIQILASDKTVELIVVPMKMIVRSTNITGYFPSGMFFFYDSAAMVLRYDFRLNYQESLFMRVKGVYENEEGFRRVIESALQNPLAYVQKNDLGYIAAKLEKLEGTVELLTGRIIKNETDITNLAMSIDSAKSELEHLIAVKESVINTRIDTAKKQLEDKIDAEMKQTRQEMTAMKTAFDDKLAKQKDSFDKKLESTRKELDARVAEMKERSDALALENFRLKWSLVNNNNRGFFGEVIPVPEETIQRIVGLKTQNPSITIEETLKTMQTEGIQTSDNVVRLVFRFFFNVSN